MSTINSLNPHDRPPQVIKDFYKYFQKLPEVQFDTHPKILDLMHLSRYNQEVLLDDVALMPSSVIKEACRQFNQEANSLKSVDDVKVYEISGFPGLRILSALIPENIQRLLLSRLLHRDLANPRHRTNVHLHHSLPYHATQDSGSSSFFRMSPTSSDLFQSNDNALHKPFTVSQFLYKKLRWLTLGGQYDWTSKRYPPEEEPPFPSDVAHFLRCIFPNTKPEAAIVNVYSPGDVLSVHRDVTETCDNGLVSVSFGNDGIFVLGLQYEGSVEPQCLAVRLRSGDAIYMDGPARFAWHGLPRIIPNTCPECLCDWPAAKEGEENSEDQYEAWRGWMSRKRVNLNVRQIRD